uniref:Uncharacterized protein n=1 Tax=Panagrolaimus sp. JU765 TaxID=591449 RepID=A0AC34QSW5_9BILA
MLRLSRVFMATAIKKNFEDGQRTHFADRRIFFLTLYQKRTGTTHQPGQLEKRGNSCGSNGVPSLPRMSFEDNFGFGSTTKILGTSIDEDQPIITSLNDNGSKTHAKKTIRRTPKPIDPQFELEEDEGKQSFEKYGSDLDISSEEDDEGDEEDDHISSLKHGNVPHSMPVTINFGIDPVTKKPRSPTARLPKKEDKVPHGSIYENMQELSRSIQPADYRNRILGTRPENVGNISSSFSYSQTAPRPRAIICNEPVHKLDVTIEGPADLEG